MIDVDVVGLKKRGNIRISKKQSTSPQEHGIMDNFYSSF